MFRPRRRWLSIVFLAPLLACSGQPTSPEQKPPTIIALRLSTPPPIGSERTVFVTCTAGDPDGDLLSYAWSSVPGIFPSGATDSTVAWQAPAVPCQCLIWVVVSDGVFAESDTIEVVVRGMPVPRFTIDPAAGTTSTTFRFDASSSEDLETPRHELEVRWSLDASWSPWGTGKTIEHRFDDGGAEEIILEVRNRAGLVTSADSTIVVGTVPFVIENLGVIFARWDRETNRAGDFYFTHSLPRVFWEFGARVRDTGGNIKELPHFTYVVLREASVFSISEGEVVRMEFQAESDDYEITIRSLVDPSYDVIYDHLVNLQVESGDRLLAGDVLGNPHAWPDWDVGSFEIMIFNRTEQLFYCPFHLFDRTTLEEYRQQVSRLIADWEEFVGDMTVYDEGDWAQVGCRYESMTPHRESRRLNVSEARHRPPTPDVRPRRAGVPADRVSPTCADPR